MADEREVWPPTEEPPPADLVGKAWLHRRGLTGIKIALFGGLLPPAIFWLASWPAFNAASLTPSLYEKVLNGVFGVLVFLSLPVMLICEIAAFVYGVQAWQCFTGKLAIVAVSAAIGGNFLFILHIWRQEGFI